MATPMDPPDVLATWADDLDLGSGLDDQPSARRRRLRWLLIPIAALLVVGATLWVLRPLGTSATSLVTATATTGTIVSSVSLSGSVASSTVDELTFGASGTVQAVNVAPGDTVTAGQVLATLDGSTLALQVAAAKATLAAAEARLATDRAGPTKATRASARDAVRQAALQLSTARRSLSDTSAQNGQSIAQAKAALASARAVLSADTKAVPVDPAQVAKDRSAVSSATSALGAARLKATLALHQAQAQVDSARLGVASAQDGYKVKIAPATSAQIDADRASVASAQQALSTLQQTSGQITSPIAGTVTAVNIKVGDQVPGSSPGAGGSSASSSSSSATGQIEVMDLAHLQVAGQASETDIPKLKMGQAATISAAALGSDTVVGSVCSVSIVGTQISGVTSYPVTVCITAPDPSLLVGMSATAAVQVSRADNAVLVPSLAVKTVGGQQVVTVLGADGTQTDVPVTTGITNGAQTQIVSGLNVGATVVESLSSTTSGSRGGAGFGGGTFRQLSGGGGFGG